MTKLTSSSELTPKADTRTSNRAVLLAALLPGPHMFSTLVRDYAAYLDWGSLFERAQVHKVGPLLARRVETCNVQGIPSEVGQRFKDLQENSTLRALRGQETLHRIAGAFDDAGIPFVLLKGQFLAHCVYLEPGVRTSQDLDLLVASSHLSGADRVLRSIGYTLFGDIPPETRLALSGKSQTAGSDRSPPGKEVAYSAPDSAHDPIDLHWSLCDPDALGVGWEAIETHITTVVVGGTRVRVLDREAMLVHLAAHAVVGRPAHLWLTHFTDLAWYLARNGKECRGDRVRGIARAWGAEVYVDRALQVVQEVLGAAVPAHLQPQRDPSPIRRAAFHSVAPGMLDAAFPRRTKAPNEWLEISRTLLWFIALHLPIPYIARQLVWQRILPLLPHAVLHRVRRSSLYCRIRAATHVSPRPVDLERRRR